MDGARLRHCLKKLLPLWKDEGLVLNSKELKLLILNLSRFSPSEFIYPRNFSVKVDLPVIASNELLIAMVAHGLLDHYSVPLFRNEIKIDEARKGFIEKERFHLLDERDFYKVDSSDFDIVSVFKVRAQCRD